MLNCPACNQPLQDDPNNSEKVLCYNCRKRYDKAKVARYWSSRQNSPQPVYPHMTEPAPETPQVPQSPQCPVYDTAAAPSYQPGYGEPQAPCTSTNNVASAMQSAVAKLPKGMAIAALVLGILSVLNCWIPAVNIIAIVFGIIALVLGLIGRSRAKKGIASGKGIALGGIITGAIGIVLSIAITVLFTVGIGSLLVENGLTYDDFVDGLENTYGVDPNDASDYTYALEDNTDTQSTTPVYNDDAAWTSLTFQLGGQEFRLMETTLSQLAASGWTLDLASQGYPDGYTVEAQQMISVVNLSHPDSTCSVYVNVANLDGVSKPIEDCVVTKISFDTYGESSDMFSLEGVQCGALPDDVKAVFGEPQETYGDASDYMNWSYETSDYSKYMDLTFVNNVLSEISVTSLSY